MRGESMKPDQIYLDTRRWVAGDAELYRHPEVGWWLLVWIWMDKEHSDVHHLHISNPSKMVIKEFFEAWKEIKRYENKER